MAEYTYRSDSIKNHKLNNNYELRAFLKQSDADKNFVQFICVPEDDDYDPFMSGKNYETADIVARSSSGKWRFFIRGLEKSRAEFVTDALNSYVGR